MLKSVDIKCISNENTALFFNAVTNTVWYFIMGKHLKNEYQPIKNNPKKKYKNYIWKRHSIFM